MVAGKACAGSVATEETSSFAAVVDIAMSAASAAEHSPKGLHTAGRRVDARV